MVLKTVKIRGYEMGLLFRDGEFKGLLGAGRHWFVDPLGKVRVEVVSQRDPWMVHDKLDMIVKSGVLKDRALVLELLACQNQRIGDNPDHAPSRFLAHLVGAFSCPETSGRILRRLARRQFA